MERSLRDFEPDKFRRENEALFDNEIGVLMYVTRKVVQWARNYRYTGPCTIKQIDSDAPNTPFQTLDACPEGVDIRFVREPIIGGGFGLKHVLMQLPTVEEKDLSFIRTTDIDVKMGEINFFIDGVEHCKWRRGSEALQDKFGTEIKNPILADVSSNAPDTIKYHYNAVRHVLHDLHSCIATALAEVNLGWRAELPTMRAVPLRVVTDYEEENDGLFWDNTLVEETYAPKNYLPPSSSARVSIEETRYGDHLAEYVIIRPQTWWDPNSTTRTHVKINGFNFETLKWQMINWQDIIKRQRYTDRIDKMHNLRLRIDQVLTLLKRVKECIPAEEWEYYKINGLVVEPTGRFAQFYARKRENYVTPVLNRAGYKFRVMPPLLRLRKRNKLPALKLVL